MGSSLGSGVLDSLVLFATEGPGFSLWLGKLQYCKSCGTVAHKKVKGKENVLLFPDSVWSHVSTSSVALLLPPLQVTNNPVSEEHSLKNPINFSKLFIWQKQWNLGPEIKKLLHDPPNTSFSMIPEYLPLSFWEWANLLQFLERSKPALIMCNDAQDGLHHQRTGCSWTAYLGMYMPRT